MFLKPLRLYCHQPLMRVMHATIKRKQRDLNLKVCVCARWIVFIKSHHLIVGSLLTAFALQSDETKRCMYCMVVHYTPAVVHLHFAPLVSLFFVAVASISVFLLFHFVTILNSQLLAFPVTFTSYLFLLYFEQLCVPLISLYTHSGKTRAFGII